jgi:hypothetical protein
MFVFATARSSVHGLAVRLADSCSSLKIDSCSTNSVQTAVFAPFSPIATAAAAMALLRDMTLCTIQRGARRLQPVQIHSAE